MNNTYREIAQVLEGAQTILLYPHVRRFAELFA